MADYSHLSHGERAMAALLEVFGSTMSHTLENEYVIALDAQSKTAVSKAVADFKGLTGWERNDFYIGKMPKLDELLKRVRKHVDDENYTKRLSAPRKRQAPFKHKLTEDERRALVQRKVVPLKAKIEAHQEANKSAGVKGGAPKSMFVDQGWYQKTNSK